MIAQPIVFTFLHDSDSNNDDFQSFQKYSPMILNYEKKFLRIPLKPICLFSINPYCKHRNILKSWAGILAFLFGSIIYLLNFIFAGLQGGFIEE